MRKKTRNKKINNCLQFDKGTRSIYNILMKIIDRCGNPDNDHYEYYGGRGIKVCDRWRNSFEAFKSDMGERPSEKHSVDRIENTGDYEPNNCRWATRKEQMRNTRANRWITYNGERKVLTDWAIQLGIHHMTLHCRLKAYSFEEAYWYYVNKKAA